MLPHNLPLEDLDVGIRELVVNINRIPDVYTDTTCEGHIWRNIPAWPTKDGWVHVNILEGKHSTLVPKMKEFLESHPYFELEEWKKLNSNQKYLHYTMIAHFESHDNGTLFDRISKSQQRDYFQRAQIRLNQNLRGWADLNGVIIQYLVENVRADYTGLPFREPLTEPPLVRGFCRRMC